MKKPFPCFMLLTAMLCTVQFFSCTVSIEPPPQTSSSSVDEANSSSSVISSSAVEYSSSVAVVPSSSSVSESMKYCVYMEMHQCFSTSQPICPAGGELSDFCPYEGSSSSYSPPITPSSSSRASSSSTASSGGTCGSDGLGDNCLWNGAGDCWPIKDQADRTSCGKNAWIFSGGTEGPGSLCSGGTFICGKDSNPPSGTATSLGCCKWDTETKCWDIYTAKEKEDCSGGSNKFKASACPDKEGTCPTF